MSGIGLFVAAITAVSLPLGYFAVGHIDLTTLLVASWLLGFGAFLAVRTFPLKVIDQTLGALANTNSQFDAAISNMSQGLLLFDADQRVVVVNRKYIEMYGLIRGAGETGHPTLPT